jgi:hypothetical protein
VPTLRAGEIHSKREGAPTQREKRYRCRLNMELDLQIYLGSCLHLYSLFETPQLPPPPPRIWAQMRGAIGQPRYTTSLCNTLGTGLVVSVLSWWLDYVESLLIFVYTFTQKELQYHQIYGSPFQLSTAGTHTEPYTDNLGFLREQPFVW